MQWCEMVEAEMHKTIRLNYHSISNDMGDLAFIRKDAGGLKELVLETKELLTSQGVSSEKIKLERYS